MQLLALYDDPSNCTEQDTEERDVSSLHRIQWAHRTANSKLLT